MYLSIHFILEPEDGEKGDGERNKRQHDFFWIF